MPRVPSHTFRTSHGSGHSAGSSTSAASSGSCSSSRCCARYATSTSAAAAAAASAVVDVLRATALASRLRDAASVSLASRLSVAASVLRGAAALASRLRGAASASRTAATSRSAAAAAVATSATTSSLVSALPATERLSTEALPTTALLLEAGSPLHRAPGGHAAAAQQQPAASAGGSAPGGHAAASQQQPAASAGGSAPKEQAGSVARVQPGAESSPAVASSARLGSMYRCSRSRIGRASSRQLALPARLISRGTVRWPNVWYHHAQLRHRCRAGQCAMPSARQKDLITKNQLPVQQTGSHSFAMPSARQGRRQRALRAWGCFLIALVAFRFDALTVQQTYLFTTKGSDHQKPTPTSSEPLWHCQWQQIPTVKRRLTAKNRV